MCEKIFYIRIFISSIIFFSLNSIAGENGPDISYVRDELGREIREISSRYSECEKRELCELYTNTNFGDVKISIYGTSNINLIYDVAVLATKTYLVTGESEIDISVSFFENQKSYYLRKSIFFQENPFLTLDVYK